MYKEQAIQEVAAELKNIELEEERKEREEPEPEAVKISEEAVKTQID